jgi:hypothetical protein
LASEADSDVFKNSAARFAASVLQQVEAVGNER